MKLIQRSLSLGLLATLAWPACDNQTATSTDPLPGDTWELPRWHWNPVTHPFDDRVFNAVWRNPNGTVYVVGQFGFVMTNRGDDGAPTDVWRQMPTPTLSHLTAITGIDTGDLFGLHNQRGEMFATGWDGTLLYFHPNPDGSPSTDDGEWRLVAGPEAAGFNVVLPVDPACPDYDGDGISDDGDSTGFSGDNRCVDGNTLMCDDNCRGTANGPQRPVIDVNVDGCVGPLDTPDPDVTRQQRDIDADGAGEVCDGDDTIADDPRRFDTALFDVWATRNGPDIQVAAVGGHGALLTYDGPSGGGSATPALQDPLAWRARSGLTYRYDDDCLAGTIPQNCGRLPPSCPALCHPRRTDCNCPVDMAQCCDDTASTGAACSDGSCAAVANACDAASGICLSLCPGCFRRQAETLRSIAGDGTSLIAVGTDGQILLSNDPTDLDLTWRAVACAALPKPLDDRPLLVAAGASADQFVVVGTAGTVLFVDADVALIDPAGANCRTRDIGTSAVAGFMVQTRIGAPAAFLSDIAVTGGMSAYAVGDGGTVLEITATAVIPHDAQLKENLHGVVAVYDPDARGYNELWIAGAGGVLVHGEYY